MGEPYLPKKISTNTIRIHKQTREMPRNGTTLSVRSEMLSFHRFHPFLKVLQRNPVDPNQKNIHQNPRFKAKCASPGEVSTSSRYCLEFWMERHTSSAFPGKPVIAEYKNSTMKDTTAIISGQKIMALSIFTLTAEKLYDWRTIQRSNLLLLPGSSNS